MGKRAKRRERVAMGDTFYNGQSTNPYRGVSAMAKPGKRKRGNSAMSGNMKQRKTRTVTGNITRDQLVNAPQGAMAEVNARGVVKTLHYRA